MLTYPILTAVDLGKVLPEFQGFISDLRFYIGLFLLIGPLVMLTLGAWMFFKPIKTPTYKAGYRTYFGMGSKNAWRFAQWLAGLIWGGLGALLTVLMIIVCIVFSTMELQAAVSAAITWLVIEVVAALVAFLVIEAVVAFRFDKNGRARVK